MRITRHDERRASRVYNTGVVSARRPPTGKKFKIPGFVPYLVLLALLVIGVIFTLRLERLQLGEVVVEGARSEDQLRLRAIVETELSGNYFWFIPRRNLFLFPEQEIIEKLERLAPRLETVSVEHNELHRLVVTVVERAPVAIACTEGGSLCHFADNRGYLFARAPHFSGNLFFGLVLPVERLVVGGQIMEAQRFADFLKLKDFMNESLREMPYDARAVRLSEVLPDGTPRFSYEVASPDAHIASWRVIIPSEFDPVELFQKMSPVFETLAVDARKENSKTLEYVDFRFGNRVFYKYQE